MQAAPVPYINFSPYKAISHMLIRVNVVQVCDATTAASSNAAGNQNRPIKTEYSITNY